MIPPLLRILIATAVISVGASAETVADRRGAILDDRANLEKDPRWIYNDFNKGFEKARQTGKPLLVVLRCIPCLACSGIDARVLLDNSDLTPLLDRFVCVRVINANTLDLARFQFDFDLSFSTLIFNGDGTLYGRYGSWSHQANPREETTDGFRRALEAALTLHQGYPANRDSLLGKQGAPSPYATPIDMPTLRGKYTRNLDWEGKVVQSCVHCHQIGDALRASHRERRERIPSRLIHPFPAPDTIGLDLAQDHPARVRSVQPGLPAHHAGIRQGDELLTLAGQPLISPADVSWALHQTADAASLPVTLRRGTETRTLQLELGEGWRNQSDISRRVGTWSLRAMALGGLQLEDLTDAQRAQRGLKPDQLALLVRHAGEYGEHAAAKRAGFLKGDVLVEIDGARQRATESAWISRLLREHSIGETVPVTVLREERRIDLKLPMQ